MKVIAFVFFATILLATYASSTPTPAPAKKDSCQKACTADYRPICGKPAEGKGTDITFGNQCVLDNYNCEKPDKKYVKSTNDECPGKAPVRL